VVAETVTDAAVVPTGTVAVAASVAVTVAPAWTSVYVEGELAGVEVNTIVSLVLTTFAVLCADHVTVQPLAVPWTRTRPVTEWVGGGGGEG
jgi:hypothetical protein